MSQLIILADNSYSVSEYVNKYTDTINSMIMEQRKIKPDTLISVLTFSESVNTLILKKPAYTLDNPLSRNNFILEGTTAFYDCLDLVLTEIPDDTVVTFIVLTDGEDNRSVRSNFFKVKEKLSRKKGRFIFLGVTKESVSLATFMGFHVSILYEPTVQCFQKIMEIINPVLQNRINGEVDLCDLEKYMEEMSL